MKYKCKCGCGLELERYDDRNRIRLFLHGHNPRKPLENHKLTLSKNGYLRISKNLYHHRYLMEKHLGRKLKKGEQVHHINEDKTDNRIENLMLLPNQKAHSAIHKRLKKYGYK